MVQLAEAMKVRKVNFVMATIVSTLSRDKFFSAKPAIPNDWEIRFVEGFSDNEIIKACEGADCLYLAALSGPINSYVLENIPTIRMIQTLGVGFDHVDIPATIRLGIPVANMPGANTTSVAEHAIGMLIAVQRRFLETDADIKSGNYFQSRNKVLGEGLKEIRGSKIGLIGFGNIGQQVAKIALMMGASISYFSPRRRSPEVERQFSAEYKILDELLSTSDIISLHMPLTEQTRNMIGKRELALMPQGSILINTARGEILNQKALIEALESEQLFGAAIDTLSPEPPDAEHPLFNCSAAAAKRLLVTPHTAGVTVGAFGRLVQSALGNMERVICGEIPSNLVNGINKRIV